MSYRVDQFDPTSHEIHEAYVQRFWMQLLGGSCPKPTVVYSNAPWISTLDLGTLKKEYRLEKTTLQTTSVGLIWRQQGCLINNWDVASNPT